MAVQSDTSRIQYAGNNSTTTSYAVPFVFQENSHLKAIARTSAGVETVVTLTNHTGAGDVNGGTVRTAVAVPATSTLTIYREVPATQTTTYAEGGDFPAASHERALDKLTQIAQQLKRGVESSVRLSEATPLNPIPVPSSVTPHVLTTVNGGAPTWETVPSVSTALNIPALTDTSTVGPSDELIVQQSGLPRRATANELFNGTATVTSANSTTGRTLTNRFADVVNVKDFGAAGDGVADDTAAFQSAANAGGTVYVPKGTYRIVGQVTVGSATTIEVANGTVFTMDCSGENGRGFFFNKAIGSGIRGDFVINASATSLGSDGSKNSCIQFGNVFDDAAPTVTRHCFCEGKIEINISGAQNVKAVYLSGWVEDTAISGVHVTGQTNFAITAHWTKDVASGLPAKTWHAHNITVQNCKVYQKSGFSKPLRGFTFSASGRVTLIDCFSDTTTLNYNLFVGDYGYTYAQNITNAQAYDISMIRCASHEATNAISCDCVSSALDGSPVWNGSSYNATVSVIDCSTQKATATPNTTTYSIAASGLSHLVVKGSYLADHRFAISADNTTNVTVTDSDFDNIGAGCVTGTSSTGLTFSNNWIHDSGTTTTSTNINAVDLTGYDNATVASNRFGANNNFRYLVSIASGTANTIVVANKFESLNTGASNPAAVFRATNAQNVLVDANTVASSVPMFYPLAADPIVIASGAITIPSSKSVIYLLIDTEASAATDDLDTINGGYEGQIVYFSTSSSSRDVTFKDGTGNMNLAGDFTCDNNQDTITLIKRGTSWWEVARSNNQ